MKVTLTIVTSSSVDQQVTLLLFALQRVLTGYDQILSSSPALVKQVLCRLFLLAAPSVDYFASLPAGCFHPSLVTPVDSLKVMIMRWSYVQTTWKSRVHALNILRQVYLDHTIEIQDHLYEPALMLAIEGITSPVYYFVLSTYEQMASEEQWINAIHCDC